MTGPVRAARILLLLGAGLTLLTALGFLLTVGATSESVGRAIWICVPGAMALVVALRMPRPSRRLRWLAIATCMLWVLGALGSIGKGDPRGVTQLVIPVAVLVLLTRRRARDYFRTA